MTNDTATEQDVVARTSSDDSGTRSVVVDYELTESVDKVWRALTDAKLLEAWLMPNDFLPVAGHRFTFRTRPMHGWDGIVHCEVLELVPQQLLAYSWRSNDLDTVVTWTLERKLGGGTLLHLEHSGFEGDGFAYQAISQGWVTKIHTSISKVLSTFD
ncbi:MAG TPA: SRPBCC domain-containing protein [Acidisarcina sp.]